MKTKMVLTVTLCLTVFLSAGAFFFCPSHFSEAAQEKKKEVWFCPMHPTYIADRQGDCPICGMRLVKQEEEESPATGAAETPQADAQIKPMPIAGDRVEVRITPEKQQLIGVKTEKVTKRPLERTIRTVGLVDYDETRLATVTSRFSGWIEKLYVDYTGKRVNQGDPLFSIYSPDMVSSEEEYLLALKNRERMQTTGAIHVLPQSDLAESAKRRLLLWGMTEEQIQELEKRGQAFPAMTFYSPITGYVLVKNALTGKQVNVGEELYKIADLSRVWVYADVYEYEAPAIQMNQRGVVSLSYYPGENFEGMVTYINPMVDPMSRTVKVRLEFDNPDVKLKPGMFANVEFRVDSGERLAVPESAVLDTGTRQIVFVAKGDGFFEPREVTLGLRWGDYFEVLGGLSEGEVVVSSGTFLIDSESRLKAALSGAGAGHQHGV